MVAEERYLRGVDWLAAHRNGPLLVDFPACREPRPGLTGADARAESSARITWSTCFFSNDVRRQKPQHGLVSAIDQDAAVEQPAHHGFCRVGRIQISSPASDPSLELRGSRCAWL